MSIKNRPYFVRADKWEDFLNHKTDDETLERCKRIDRMINMDVPVIRNRREDMEGYEIAEILRDWENAREMSQDSELLKVADNTIDKLLNYGFMEEGRAREAENALEKVSRILCNPLIVEQVVNGKPTLRPVKDTSRQDVYRTVLLAQAAIKINYRRIPKRLYPEWVSRELDELGKED